MGTPTSDADKLLEFGVGICDAVALCADQEADPQRWELLEQRCEEIKGIITVLDGEVFPGM